MVINHLYQHGNYKYLKIQTDQLTEVVVEEEAVKKCPMKGDKIWDKLETTLIMNHEDMRVIGDVVDLFQEEEVEMSLTIEEVVVNLIINTTIEVVVIFNKEKEEKNEDLEEI